MLSSVESGCENLVVCVGELVSRWCVRLYMRCMWFVLLVISCVSVWLFVELRCVVSSCLVVVCLVGDIC